MLPEALFQRLTKRRIREQCSFYKPLFSLSLIVVVITVILLDSSCASMVRSRLPHESDCLYSRYSFAMYSVLSRNQQCNSSFQLLCRLANLAISDNQKVTIYLRFAS